MNRWQLDCKDVMTWCAEYDGPKFHAMLCDPPYHLTSITERFGKKDAAPAKFGRDGAFQRISKGFMGSTWDGETGGSGIAFRPETWAALKEHLLPGAFGMAFASSRGWHRLACAIEDAGLRIHPSIFCWVQGQGFCKATNIHLQLEKRLCYQDESKDWFYKDDNKPIRIKPPFRHPTADRFYGHRYGGQALAPKVEPIIVFQKPYEGRPVDSIVETGAGALFIDGGRVQSFSLPNPRSGCNLATEFERGTNIAPKYGRGKGLPDKTDFLPSQLGRWPPSFCLLHVPPHPCPDCDGAGCDACDGTGLVGGCRRVGTKRVKNPSGPASGPTFGKWGTQGVYGSADGNERLIPKYHADADGCEEVAAWQCVEECAARRIGEQSGARSSGALTYSETARAETGKYGIYGQFKGKPDGTHFPSSTGTAARFFPQFGWAAEVAERLAAADQVRYCAKASRGEREAGLNSLPLKTMHRMRPDKNGPTGLNKEPRWAPIQVRNIHSTVKPISLCHWLATLLLPPPEYAPRRILVPFAGVMSEAIAAMLTGWEEIVAIEMSEEYCTIGEARMQFWSRFPSYKAAMEAARSAQRGQRKREAEVEKGQLGLW